MKADLILKNYEIAKAPGKDTKYHHAANALELYN